MTVKFYFEKTGQSLDKAVTAGLTEVGILLLNDMKKNTPVDLGELKESENYKVRKNIVRIGTNLEYGPFVEFGTGIFEKFGRGRKTPWVYYNERIDKFITTKGQKPRSFARKAFDDNVNKIVPVFNKQFVRVLS